MRVDFDRLFTMETFITDDRKQKALDTYDTAKYELGPQADSLKELINIRDEIRNNPEYISLKSEEQIRIPMSLYVGFVKNAKYLADLSDDRSCLTDEFINKVLLYSKQKDVQNEIDCFYSQTHNAQRCEQDANLGERD